MKHWKQMAMALSLAAATTACAGDRDTEPARDTPATVGTAGAEGTAVGLNANLDRDFVADMMADGRTEVELGKLAEQKARNREVKEFAAMMVQDHSKAGDELKAALSRANVEAASIEVDTEHGKELRERLASLSGMEFDREYMKAMVDDHEKAVDAVESKADGAGNDHLKAWAAQTLPALKKHLERARQINESLGKRSQT